MKKSKLKVNLKRYPLICPVCGTVARKEFEGELCGVCGEGTYERREK